MLNTKTKYRLSFVIILLICIFLMSELVIAVDNIVPNSINQINEDMFRLYKEGNKQEAFNIYKKTLQDQAINALGYDVKLFPKTEKELKAFQDELEKQGFNKSIDDIKAYTRKSEDIHWQLFKAIMEGDSDRMGVVSQNLAKLNKDFFEKQSITNNNKKDENNEIHDGGLVDEGGKIIDTVEVFIDTWSDYISNRDNKGNLKAFSDIHLNTPNSLIIREDDGIAMSSFKVLGKGGYYLFLKARLWIAEGYGEIGSFIGEMTSKYLDR